MERADVTGTETLFQNTEDEEMDQEIEQEIKEADQEMEKSAELAEQTEQASAEEPRDDAQSVLSDVVNDVEEVSQGEILKESSEVSADFSSVLNDEKSTVLGDASTISQSLDDASDKEVDQSEEIEFESVATTELSSGSESDSNAVEENLDEGIEQEEQSEEKEVIDFGEGESEEEAQDKSESGSEQEETSESAAEKTKEELEGEDETPEEYKDEIAEGLGEEPKSFDDVFNDAMEKAIKTDPKAESVVVIAYDKENKEPEIKNINVDNFRKGIFKNGALAENQNAQDLMVDEVAVPVDTDKTAEEQKMLLHEKIEELEKDQIKGHLEDKKNELAHPKGIPDHSSPFSGTPEFEEFDKNGFEAELVKQQEAIADSMNQGSQGNEHNEYLKNQEQAREALRLFAESDAIKRAAQPLPPGIPDQVFLSDLMGVSGVGEYEPSSNMLHYYGQQSGFQGHFANKARNQISFEDIDTLTGLLSDLNGVFITIFNLLPSKKEAESETEEEPVQKDNFERAYDVLKFYSRVRGFVHTLVFNRHLIVQDIQFLKDKVENLNSTQEDMLRFYGIEVEYARMKVRASKFTNDMKIKKSLSNIRGIAYNFAQDVKIALKALFTLEKAIVFFDNDVRSLSHSINTRNPLEAIKTVDNVLLFITRLFEVKIDLFHSIVGMKDSLMNLKKYRADITKEIRNCDKLANYYELIGGNVSIPNVWLTFGLVSLFAWALNIF